MQSEFWAHESTFLYYAAILDLVTMKGWSEGKFAEVAGVPPPLPPSPHTPSDSDCWLVASHSYDAVLMSSPLSLVFEFIGNTFTPKSDFIHSPLMPDNSGADLGGGCRGAHLSPPPPEMKPSSLYSPSKFVYLTGQWRHSLEVQTLLRKILDLPLWFYSSKGDLLRKVSFAAVIRVVT